MTVAAVSAAVAPIEVSNDVSMSDEPASTNERVDRKMALMNELDTAADHTMNSIRYMRDNLKARASCEETTIEAIVWLTRLSWAVQDCQEYKMRQLFTNCDDNVLDSIPTVIQHFHKLIENAELMNERFRQHVVVPNYLVAEVCSFGTTVKDAFYQI
jgi:hypothetical protein